VTPVSTNPPGDPRIGRRAPTEATRACPYTTKRTSRAPKTPRRPRLLANAKRALLLEATGRIVEQTRLRVSGHTPDGASRRVSLHDPDARPIRKGRLGKPVEFGHKAQVVDNDDGIVLDHTVEQGNPPDAPQLAPAVNRVTKAPGARHAPSPPTAATAKPTSINSSPTSASPTW
jgi:hypothetical protein